MGTGFLIGIDIFHGYGFGMAKPSGFVPVAISILALSCGTLKSPCILMACDDDGWMAILFVKKTQPGFLRACILLANDE
jgi:hypothetical protein